MVKRSRRRQQRGAAVFVVVLAVTLLTAIGVFAVHTALMVDQAAGYVRLARQTQFLAEYGTLTSATELGTLAGKTYSDLIHQGSSRCRANAPLAAGTPCYKFDKAFLNRRTTAFGNQTILSAATPGSGIPGSFGLNDKLVGDFIVELTDPGPVGQPVAGAQVGTGSYIKVTSTSTAQIRSNNVACTNAVTTTLGQQSLRAHLLIGPILK